VFRVYKRKGRYYVFSEYLQDYILKDATSDQVVQFFYRMASKTKELTKEEELRLEKAILDMLEGAKVVA
jgi:hypothetical protein